MYLCIYVSIYLSIQLSSQLSIYLFIYLSILSGLVLSYLILSFLILSYLFFLSSYLAICLSIFLFFIYLSGSTAHSHPYFKCSIESFSICFSAPFYCEECMRRFLPVCLAVPLEKVSSALNSIGKSVEYCDFQTPPN